MAAATDAVELAGAVAAVATPVAMEAAVVVSTVIHSHAGARYLPRLGVRGNWPPQSARTKLFPTIVFDQSGVDCSLR